MLRDEQRRTGTCLVPLALAQNRAKPPQVATLHLQLLCQLPLFADLVGVDDGYEECVSIVEVGDDYSRASRGEGRTRMATENCG